MFIFSRTTFCWTHTRSWMKSRISHTCQIWIFFCQTKKFIWQLRHVLTNENITFQSEGKQKVIWDTYDIYKDERSPKSVYNHSFNSFKIYNICPNNAFFKYEKQNLCNVRTHDPQIAILVFYWLSCMEIYQILLKWK